jgi:hypothetical protein
LLAGHGLQAHRLHSSAILLADRQKDHWQFPALEKSIANIAASIALIYFTAPNILNDLNAAGHFRARLE